MLLGFRSITVDGNTLDTTLQLMLAAQHAVGIESGLRADDDVAVSREKLRILAASFKQNLPVATVTNLSIPGPVGPIPARHYRPAEGYGPLLVFYHGGGQVIGDLDTHDDVCRQICREGGLHVLSVDTGSPPSTRRPPDPTTHTPRFSGRSTMRLSWAPTPAGWPSAATAQEATSPRW